MSTVILHRGESQRFDLSLDYNSLHNGKRDKGWSMSGHYNTKTDRYGESFLNIEGSLHSPQNLQPENNHYAIWVFGNVSGGTEWCWAGYEPGDAFEDIDGKKFSLGQWEKSSVIDVHHKTWNELFS